jgi:predicted nucleic acid-binding protein
VNLVVDTSVWSLVLRRRKVDESNPYVIAFRQHVNQGDCLFLMGNILQELLDGVSTPKDFQHLIGLLKPFPLLETQRETFILASELRNNCRKKGVQASPVDFLISAACIENSYPLLTSDGDFTHIASHSELIVLKI